MRYLPIVVVAACGDGNRVLLELQDPAGAMPGVATVELILADPVIAAKRGQHTNSKQVNDPTTETVFYIAQRDSVQLDLDPSKSIDGFQLQLAATDTETYEPIVIARDAQQQIVGAGLLRPEEVFTTTGDPGQVTGVEYLSDITYYTIQLEPVSEPIAVDVGTPTFVGDSNLVTVNCEVEGKSGYAWRRARLDHGPSAQLRIVLPLEGGDARDRLAHGGDLDCDKHTPKRQDDGDERDCDDLTPSVFGGGSPHEVCNFVDDDCDGKLTGFDVVHTCTGANTCGSTGVGCYEGGPLANAGCPVKLTTDNCGHCSVPNTAINAPDATACPGRALLSVPPGCAQGGCSITLIDADPRWVIKIGEPNMTGHGLLSPFFPMATQLEIEAVPQPGQAGYLLNANGEASGGSFTMFIRPTDPTIAAFTLALQLDLQLANRTTSCPPSTSGQSMICNFGS